MAKYTAADIKALREKTGAGMLDVKKALDEADGDAEKAHEIIRVKGLKGIAKREGRSTSEGVVATDIRPGEGGQVGTMVEINCETDFVAKSGPFIEIAEKAAAYAAENNVTSPEGLTDGDFGQTFTDATAPLGEKIVIRRVARVSGEHVEVYLHRTAKDLPPQVGVLIATDEKGAEVAHDVAMHIAAFSPKYLSREDVPAEKVEDERRIAEETAKNEGKPEKALPKIVEGRMNGFFKENCLLDQAYARDPKKTVGQIVEASGGSVTGFARFRVGA
ncbi:MAG: translation elongation factor Ts [Bowdeniella nasicola]|nr:translation elongation factor Ts [Bowdeniella nasicola]